MIIGIGCDLIEIARVEALYARFNARMLQRMLTRVEQQQVAQKANSALRFAKYIAAKEAAYKALPAIAQEGFGWCDAEVRYGEKGKPELHYSNAISAKLPAGFKAHLSLSDSDSHAMAYVVLEA